MMKGVGFTNSHFQLHYVFPHEVILDLPSEMVIFEK